MARQCPACGGAGRINRGRPDEFVCGACNGAGVLPDKPKKPDDLPDDDKKGKRKK